MTDEEVPASDLPDQEVPVSDMPDYGQEVPPEDLPQQASGPAEAGLEGAFRGATFGLSDALASGMRKGATTIGVPQEYLHYVAPAPEELAANKEQNPIASTAGEFAGSMIPLAKLPQVGSKAVDTMIKMGAMGAGDELSKYFLGEGDPTTGIVGHIAMNGAMGLLGGKLLGPLEEKGLQAVQNLKLGTTMKSFLAGIGHAATVPGQEVVDLASSAYLPEEIKDLSNGMFKFGQQIYNNAIPGMAGSIAWPIAEHFGKSLGTGAGAGIATSVIAKQLTKKLGPLFEGISEKYIAPMVMGIARSGSADQLGYVLDHAANAIKGNAKIQKGIESLFESGGNKALDVYDNEKMRKKLNEYLENGGLEVQINKADMPQAQNKAHGGEIANTPMEMTNPIDKVIPGHSMIESAAKARVAGFLNNQRPQQAPKMPFDVHRSDKNHEREYNKMLDLANQPLGILNDIKSGRITPKTVNAFKSMYPELHQHMTNQIMEHVADKMHNNERPSHRLRQGLSLFIGSDLDSSLTQPVMALAQSTFVTKAQQSPQPQAKGSKQNLNKIGQSAMTGDQAREKREQKV